jgi:hypothetical protein
MKGNVKTIVAGLLAAALIGITALSVSGGVARTLTESDFMMLESNTYQCLADCEAIIILKNPTLELLPFKDTGLVIWFESLGGSLQSLEVFEEKTVTEIVDAPVEAEVPFEISVFNPDTGRNETQTVLVKRTVGTQPTAITKTKWVPLETAVLAPGEQKRVRVTGHKTPVLGPNDVDWKIDYRGFRPAWAQWLSGWSNRKNLTFSDSLAPAINRTGEVVTLNITGLTLMTNNCREGRLLNDTDSEIQYFVESNGTSSPSNGNKWCQITFVINKTTSNLTYQWYYNNSNADLNYNLADLVSTSGSSNKAINGTNWDGIMKDDTGYSFSTIRDASGTNYGQGANWALNDMYDSCYIRRSPTCSGASFGYGTCNDVFCEAIGNLSGMKVTYRFYPYFVQADISDNNNYNIYFVSTAFDDNYFCNATASGDLNACDQTATYEAQTHQGVNIGYMYNRSGSYGWALWQNTTSNVIDSHWTTKDGDGSTIVFPANSQPAQGRANTVATRIRWGFPKTSAWINAIPAVEFWKMNQNPVNITIGAEQINGSAPPSATDSNYETAKASPHLFYGTATGSTITAEILGEQKSSASITSGKYFLTVKGNASNYDQTITIKIDGVQKWTSSKYKPGETTQIDL